MLQIAFIKLPYIEKLLIALQPVTVIRVGYQSLYDFIIIIAIHLKNIII